MKMNKYFPKINFHSFKNLPNVFLIFTEYSKIYVVFIKIILVKNI